MQLIIVNESLLVYEIEEQRRRGVHTELDVNWLEPEGIARFV